MPNELWLRWRKRRQVLRNRRSCLGGIHEVPYTEILPACLENRSPIRTDKHPSITVDHIGQVYFLCWGINFGWCKMMGSSHEWDLGNVWPVYPIFVRVFEPNLIVILPSIVKHWHWGYVTSVNPTFNIRLGIMLSWSNRHLPPLSLSDVDHPGPGVTKLFHLWDLASRFKLWRSTN